MIIYSDDDKLITTKLEVSGGCGIRDLCYSAEFFRGRETRFFKIISEDTVSRSINCLTQRSRFNEAKKIFYEVTGVADSYECYDNENNIGFLLPPMDKSDLFSTVIADGALPRKTFSMGEACEKRFYLEARKIK